MISTSGSFEYFMEQFKEKHPAWFGANSGGSVAAKAPMPKAVEKPPEKPVSVAPNAVVEDGWDAAEVVEVEEPENWWDK